ncbi:HupE/UreJ family protein [Microbacterium ulmi]|uniref:HupE/UreJ family protein n=1 Tax=Microbacterium ulmi TaxID=179095 RepID=A0A7Y2M171_9MICO|nr:HupE/UreJ family protein [Microbacterium ulmi]NII68926.1 putative membrane protein [Microbacterium ulmi]NNH03909.1 HupE/UreJ family protein [Microbacterium ulmi]
MPRRSRPSALALLAGGAVLLTGLLAAAPASAHGFTSVVYAEVTAAEDGAVRTELQLEYDLLVVSAADAEHDDPLFQDGTAAFEAGDAAAQAAVLEAHRDSVLAYVGERFTVTAGGETCTPAQVGAITMTQQQDVPYAVLVLEHECEPSGDGHVVASELFGDEEGYVTGTKVVLTYDIDGRSGSAALDASQPSFSTQQSAGERFWEFFHLGAEHLLTGIDHILFLLALIAGSRRLREVVLAATSFTVAHSVTFILAATGVVSVSSAFVEPVIALSIAIVASWHLWQLWRRGDAADELDKKSGPWGLDGAGWLRLGVVFAFGLVHGLGFAGALGIDEPWSWTLLWSLLVFNLGIEAVQLTIIAVLFPILALVRRRAPRVGLWATGALAVSVSIAGLIWFVQRIFGL